MTPKFRPLRGALVRLLPEPPSSRVLEVVKHPDLTRRAIVQDVGNDCPDLKIGDVVLCRPMQGVEVGDLMLIPSSGLMATVTE